MGQGRMKPARAQGAMARAEDDLICDLDVIVSRRVTFVLRGTTHVLEPITTERFFDFYQQVGDFQNLEQKTSDATNLAYFKIVRSICETITQDDVNAMTVIQKSNLLSHLVRKILGNKESLEGPEKKKSVI